MQKQQEVVVAGASLPASAKVNTAGAGDPLPVNGQAKTHTENPEKVLEPEAAEEALENGPKGMDWPTYLPTQMSLLGPVKVNVRKRS